jgi:tripeptide aminopeptidase
MERIAAYMNEKYGDGTVQLTLRDQYYNMREKIEPVYYIVELARVAMEEVGVKPIIKPIRGGTDGSRLSYMDLPCPNVFAGGHNFHGRYEYLPVRSLEKSVEVIVKIVEKASSQDFMNSIR